MRLKVVVGAEGEVALPAAEAEAVGGGGEFTCLTAPGVAFLANSSTGGAWLAGTFDTSSFGEVAQTVAASLKTGALQVLVGPAARRRRKIVHFREGRVVFASSSDPADRLGPVLVRAGVITHETLERCTALVVPNRPLGHVLVEQGVLTPGKLYDGVVLQVTEIFLSLFHETSGQFLFREGPLDARSEVRLAERTRDLILEGLRRLEQAKQATASSPPSVAATPAPPAGANAAPPAATSPPPSAAVSPAMVSHLAVPASAPVPAIAPSAASAAPAAAGGPFQAYRRLFRAIYMRLERAVPDATARLDSGIDRLPDAQRKLFEGVRFGARGDLDVSRVLANVGRTNPSDAVARARALEALEALFAFAIFEARNRLGHGEAEALRREVGKIQMGG